MFRLLHDDSTRLALLSLCSFLALNNQAISREQTTADQGKLPSKTLVPIDQVPGPLPEDFVVAEIDGSALLLGEFIASTGLANQMDELREKISPSKFRELQEKRLKSDLRLFLEQRLLARRFLDELTAEESNRLTQGLATAWQEQIDKMIQRINLESAANLANTEELQNHLREHRQPPLEVLQKQFEGRLMAIEFLHRNVTVKDRDKREQATKAFIEYVYANANVRTCLDGIEK